MPGEGCGCVLSDVPFDIGWGGGTEFFMKTAFGHLFHFLLYSSHENDRVYLTQLFYFILVQNISPGIYPCRFIFWCVAHVAIFLSSPEASATSLVSAGHHDRDASCPPPTHTQVHKLDQASMTYIFGCSHQQILKILLLQTIGFLLLF